MKNPEKIARSTKSRKKPLKPLKRKAHPNSLANLIPPSAPPFSSTYQPDPQSLCKPKKATRAEIFEAFLEKKARDPKTGEETTRLAIIMAKAWRMFMEGNGEDDVKPSEFLAFCQFSFDGYFGKQGEKLTLEDNRPVQTSLTSFSRDEIFAGVKHGILALQLEDLEKIGELLENEIQKKTCR